MGRIKHIIDRMVVEVNTSDERTAYWIKDNIGSFLRKEVFPEIEQLFDNDDADDVIRMDRLAIELNASFDEPDDMKDEIVRLISKALLPAKTDSGFGPNPARPNGAQVIPLRKRNRDLFLFFLENGYLPWYASPRDMATFLSEENWENNMNETDFSEQLKALLIRNKTAGKRLVLQVVSRGVIAFLRKINASINELKSDIDTVLNNLPGSHQKVFLRLLLHQSLFGDSMSEIRSSEGFYRELEDFAIEQDVLNDSDFYRKTSPVFKALSGEMPLLSRLQEGEEPAPEIPLSDGITTEDGLKTPHAGLILLHPFLPHFFEILGLTDHDKKIKSDEMEIAVQCLAYMVTGQTNFFEGDMILEKFLCDMPLEIPVSRDDLTFDEIKSEVSAMLQDVVKHWPALKNTSPDGLRAMFLQRDGKLFNDNGKQRLIVERKTQDVLLGKLDWNISMIKLPWKDEFLFVDW